MSHTIKIPSPLEQLDTLKGVEIWIKRDDLIHPEISGNKWRKLKYYIEDFNRSAKTEILTFGGAFSNHLAASAAAGKLFGINTHALVRGDELSHNATLDFCRNQGMQIESISRSKYNLKDEPDFLEALKETLPQVYIIPEGGKGVKGVLGCAEILKEVEAPFDIVCAAAGTGTTMAGMLLSNYDAEFLAFPALKGGAFLKRAIADQLLAAAKTLSTSINEKKIIESRLSLKENYHFSGYGKVNDQLINFMNGFYDSYGLKLDPVYTGKMMFGLFDLIEKGEIESGKRVLVIHSGGLQGIAGMNERLKFKGKIHLNYEK